jgi:hypothetical protein
LGRGALRGLFFGDLAALETRALLMLRSFSRTGSPRLTTATTPRRSTRLEETVLFRGRHTNPTGQRRSQQPLPRPVAPMWTHA